ncbi:hypothetical protein OCHUTO_1030 [Orientia chuto str. Dubai]|uniref:Uncharacterized protein n=1 Tax=Orientia chuto str. Dubai TaxID=1359168 RepID=A0A0F3MHG6_9RICK|nr:hypothetical protein OCHUTO_1030 [Orientia chuto str. Dubai]
MVDVIKFNNNAEYAKKEKIDSANYLYGWGML